MIKGIIFDIDGVLLDSLGIWDDLGARYLQSIGPIFQCYLLIVKTILLMAVH